MQISSRVEGRARLAKSLGIAAALAVGLASSVAAAGDEEVPWSSESEWDIPGEYVVDFRDDVPDADISSMLSSLGVAYQPTELEAETNIQIVSAGTGALASLDGDARIEHLEPLAKVKLMWVPDDPMFAKQWHMTRVGAESSWEIAAGRGVTVAVIDTGIACETFESFTKATDLADTVCVDGFNFIKKGTHANDDHGHGTHVAGTIAQSTNNGLGTTGLAFGARLMPVKVLSGDGWGTTAGVADGIRWAADNGAQVINLSLGSPRNSSVLQAAVDHARSKGVIIVAAAGNSGGKVGFPGASKGVIGVSATDQSNGLAWFSSRGEGVDIGAPGVNVTQQTICQKGRNKCEIFGTYNGTSMASPHVAAAAALLVGMGVTDPEAVEQILFDTAKELDSSPEGRGKFGAGLLQADAAAFHVHKTQVLTRALWLLVGAAMAFAWARRRGETLSATSPGFWLGGLMSSVGALFFLPWIASRHGLVLDWLSRPIGDWDLLRSASLHQWLPLANAGVPLALAAVLYKVRGTQGFLAGLSVGTAAYLGSTITLGWTVAPFGWTLGVVWFALNAFVCLYLASLLLLKRK
jgi:serine protease